MVEGPDGKFHLAEMPERLPTMFTLEARMTRRPYEVATVGRVR